jgi:hypothetical protein
MISFHLHINKHLCEREEKVKRLLLATIITISISLGIPYILDKLFKN